MKYCYENLTDKDIGFFESFPLCREITFDGAGSILACHGSPDKNNEKMFPDGENTKGIMERCAGQYILCGHTHVLGSFSHEGKILLNPGSVGVSLYSGGKAQFMILYQNGEEWGASVYKP